MNTLPLAGTPLFRPLAAFTLLELLVVISIIAVLAGVLLPVSNSVMDSARKTEAKSTESQIVTAVKSFQTDYGVYPNPAPGVASDKTWRNDTNQSLFSILRALDDATSSVNTRRIVYFEGKDVKTPSTPKSGFATQDASNTVSGITFTVKTGGLTDPWGNGYYVRYDTGYSDAVLHPYTNDGDAQNETSSTANDTLHFGIIAWSYGKDGQKGNKNSTGTAPNYTYGDDVLSWQ